MPAPALHQVDFNLLLTFDQLLRHGSVTAAADACGVTQSAMSRSLARLRTIFDDPLFVRHGNRMMPTARAEHLREPLQCILAQMSALIAPVRFDPARASGTFRLAITSNVICSLLPDVLVHLRQQAPGLMLEISGWNDDTLDTVARDGVDLAFGVARSAPAGIYQRRVFCDDFLCAVRDGHPLLERGGMNIENYCAWPHTELSLGSDMRSVVDDALAAQGRQRSLGLLTPHFWASLEVVSRSTLIMTAPSHLLHHYRQGTSFTILPPPDIGLPELDYTLFWHARHHHDPRHAWIRRTLCDMLRQRMDTKAVNEAEREILAVATP
ncbi:LysR family transcriptional regulator [Jeongeupia chitinilytica]|uniref:LysR family transcriptional regulator n=1 Tax=Jeongeupia chitinilytica TaxID=1041641 RepID=A0ABQ3H1C1_9NEIS|nr:LysR family transcriptional regulator [Jeongeupia chitinilytica]GHD63662.1 LysR family transcriptional regulator [Jeongeupia chitinilytica]